MRINLDLEVAYEDGVLLLRSRTGGQLMFLKDHVAQKRIEMVTLGELSNLPIKDICALFGFRTRKSYYDIRRLVMSDDVTALIPQKRGPKGPRKRTRELEVRIIQLRLTTAQNMYEMAKTLQREGFDVSPRLVAQVLQTYGISKKKAR